MVTNDTLCLSVSVEFVFSYAREGTKLGNTLGIYILLETVQHVVSSLNLDGPGLKFQFCHLNDPVIFCSLLLNFYNCVITYKIGTMVVLT